MNVKRFIGRNSREALQKVKEAFGGDAVVLSTKPTMDGGIEILAMAGDSVPSMEAFPAPEPQADAGAAKKGETSVRSAMSHLASTVQDDVKQLAMSTLSFQDYVRERMLKRRQAALQERTEPALAGSPGDQLAQRLGSARAAQPSPVTVPSVDLGLGAEKEVPPQVGTLASQKSAATVHARHPVQRESASVDPQVPAASQEAPVAAPATKPTAAAPRGAARIKGEDLTLTAMTASSAGNAAADGAALQALKLAQEANASMLAEVRAMRAMMKERFETIAFVEKLGRTPAQAGLAQKLMDGGFSTTLIRKMLDAMPEAVNAGVQDEMQWASMVLERNLNTAEAEPALEDRGGAIALIGSTGVGKTTSTAKLAAMFAAKHGASNLGLITLDAYRVGAHDQLRAYGRILGVPVHMAHDRAALEDLLELLSGKKMVLIDTAGMAQRDGRTKELLDMLAHPRIRKVLVLNAASQGDAIEDVMNAYRAQDCDGVILSKLDEAVKLGPALDALIRHKTRILGVANGQRVPEDWHRLSAQALVHRAMRASLNPAYRLDPSEVSLMFTLPPVADSSVAASNARRGH